MLEVVVFGCCARKRLWDWKGLKEECRRWSWVGQKKVSHSLQKTRGLGEHVEGSLKEHVGGGGTRRDEGTGGAGVLRWL